MYFVCVYPGCKTLLPKVVACEGPLIMMTGSLSPKKKNYKKKKKKRGCSLIRACSLIRSNTVTQIFGILFILQSPSATCMHMTASVVGCTPSSSSGV